jgi:hypothetical protein
VKDYGSIELVFQYIERNGTKSILKNLEHKTNFSSSSNDVKTIKNFI